MNIGKHTTGFMPNAKKFFECLFCKHRKNCTVRFRERVKVYYSIPNHFSHDFYRRSMCEKEEELRRLYRLSPRMVYIKAREERRRKIKVAKIICYCCILFCIGFGIVASTNGKAIASMLSILAITLLLIILYLIEDII